MKTSFRFKTFNVFPPTIPYRALCNLAYTPLPTASPTLDTLDTLLIVLSSRSSISGYTPASFCPLNLPKPSSTSKAFTWCALYLETSPQLLTLAGFFPSCNFSLCVTFSKSFPNHPNSYSLSCHPVYFLQSIYHNHKVSHLFTLLTCLSPIPASTLYLQHLGHNAKERVGTQVYSQMSV